jgi:hypothetical protein
MTSLISALFITFSLWFGDGNFENSKNKNNFYPQKEINHSHDGGSGGFEDIWSDE